VNVFIDLIEELILQYRFNANILFPFIVTLMKHFADGTRNIRNGFSGIKLRAAKRELQVH
jgi:hypothetical protein